MIIFRILQTSNSMMLNVARTAVAVATNIVITRQFLHNHTHSLTHWVCMSVGAESTEDNYNSKKQWEKYATPTSTCELQH